MRAANRSNRLPRSVLLARSLAIIRACKSGRANRISLAEHTYARRSFGVPANPRLLQSSLRTPAACGSGCRQSEAATNSRYGWCTVQNRKLSPTTPAQPATRVEKPAGIRHRDSKNELDLHPPVQEYVLDSLEFLARTTPRLLASDDDGYATVYRCGSERPPALPLRSSVGESSST